MNSPTHVDRTSRILDRAINAGSRFLEDADLEFFHRVWQTDPDVYRTRLEAIKFVNLGNVLDAGSGMGQWTMPLSHTNGFVYGVDSSASRVRASQTIMRELDITNVEITQQSVEQIGYPDAMFDAVFTYSVLFLTDYKRSLREFSRVLKPGGHLYICGNGIGWYLHNLINAPYSSPNYNPRRFALDVALNTLVFRLLGKRLGVRDLIVSSRSLENLLYRLGFENVLRGGEGTINLDHAKGTRSFFRSRYYGLEGVYELLAWKKAQV